MFTEQGVSMLSAVLKSKVTVRTSAAFHDRFLVIDGQRLYLFGASLKDLGKKCFAFTKLDAAEIPRIVERSATEA